MVVVAYAGGEPGAVVVEATAAGFTELAVLCAIRNHDLYGGREGRREGGKEGRSEEGVRREMRGTLAITEHLFGTR